METPIELAVRRAGGQTALAKAIRASHPKVKQQHVWKWLRARTVPAERVLAIEAATGISRYDLRPDVFGPPPKCSDLAPPTEEGVA